YAEINGCGFGAWNDQNAVAVRNYVLEIDFIHLEPTSSISGMKWYDADANGIKDEGEEGLSNWKIILEGAKQEFEFTDEEGMYAFDGLTAGAYTVSEEQQQGWIQTFPDAPAFYSVTLSANEKLNGINFGNTHATYTITATAGASGTIEPAGETIVEYGESLHFVATPSAGYHIFNMTIDGELLLDTTEYTFENIAANHSIVATFAINMYTLSLSIDGSGSITKNPDQNIFAHGTEVQLTAVPASDWDFAGWSGDASGKGNPLVVTMDTIKNIGAIFTASYPQLEPSLSTVDFDSVLFGETAMDSISVANIGTDTAEVFSVTSNSELFTMSPTNGVILPNESLKLYCTFDAAVPGQQEGFFVIAHNGASSPDTLFAVGFALDVTRFRTMKADSFLSVKAVKLKKSRAGVYPLPTTGNVRDTILKRALQLKVGKQQGNKDSAKVYGWLEWKKGPDVAKFFAYAHTGRSYPLDSIRLDGKKTKKLVKAFKATRKGYNNPLAAELTAFKLNIFGSERGTLPSGLNSVQLVLEGNPFNLFTLGQIADTLDYFMTYWKRDTLLVNATTAESVKTLLKRVNDVFAEPIDDTTDVLLYEPLVLRGKVQISEVNYLRRTSPRNTGIQNFASANTVADEFVLEQNYPNPFNPTTAIGFSLVAVGNVSLKIYNVLGQEVATLINNEIMDEGEHEILFDAGALSSGVYFYRLSINGGEFTQTRKLLLMK
ncbi:MAG: SdrD B-like domain-containing protein, partial [Bacteroidota bacterium]